MKFLEYEEIEGSFKITSLWKPVRGLGHIDEILGIDVRSGFGIFNYDPVRRVYLPERIRDTQIDTKMDHDRVRDVLDYLSEREINTEADVSWVTLKTRTLFFSLDKDRTRRVDRLRHNVSLHKGILITLIKDQEVILHELLSTTIEEVFYSEPMVEL